MFTALLRGLRIMKVEQVSDLTSAYAPTQPFSVFLAPTSGGSVSEGDVVIVSGTLPYASAATDVPVVAGDWSPVVFSSIAAAGIDLDEVDLYVAPIEIE